MPHSFCVLVRLGALQVDPQEPRKFFLDIVDELSTRKLSPQLLGFALELFDALRGLVGLQLGRRALTHRAGVEIPVIALLSPSIKLRRVDTFTPQKGANLADLKRIRFANNAQLVGSSKATSLRLLPRSGWLNFR
jgi:hypothetical protein